MDLLETRTVDCPCCWQPNELVLDLSGGSQVYTEDCTVCCRPMVVTVTIDGATVAVQVEGES